MTALVVGRNGNVHELGRGVGIAERDDGDVDVRGLFDGLGVGARVRDDDETRLFEGARDVVGEVAGGEATGDGGGAGVRGEFEDGALAVGAGGDDGDVGGVVDGDDCSGGEDELFPGVRISLVIWQRLGLAIRWAVRGFGEGREWGEGGFRTKSCPGQ